MFIQEFSGSALKTGIRKILVYVIYILVYVKLCRLCILQEQTEADIASQALAWGTDIPRVPQTSHKN